MDISDLKRVRRNLNKFVRRFESCIKDPRSRRHLKTYVSGQVSHLERKSAEPIALQAKVAPRSLQEFLSQHGWKASSMRDQVQKIVVRDHGDPDAIATIDETGCPKKGRKTVGVKRQYCGATGKVDNCVVSVHLGYVTEGFHTLLDSDLFLPEDWCADAERRAEAGIPDSVEFRKKWQIALDELEYAKENGVPFCWVTADEGYGKAGAFRQGVSDLGKWYVVEIPCSMTGWTRRPGRGPLGKPARRVDKLWRRGGPSWQTFHVKETEAGPVVWDARVTGFFMREENGAITEKRLMVARNVLDGEVKYFLSNAPVDIPVEQLLHVAFSRAAIEREFEDSKGEIGFDHFEVRGYKAVMHHFALSLVSHLFLAEEAYRLKGKKKLPPIHVEPAPSPPRGRGPTG